MSPLLRKSKASRTHLTEMIKRCQKPLFTCMHLHPRLSAGARLEIGHEEGDETSLGCEGL